MDAYTLDRYDPAGKDPLDSSWKSAVQGRGSQYASLLETVIKTGNRYEYPVDPLLFMALLKQESGFNPRTVSHVGAVGLAQIMPRTARNLGMSKIFEPDYYQEAGRLMQRERKLRRKAMTLIDTITGENMENTAKEALKLMQTSLECRKKRKALFARYKSDLLKEGIDDRLSPNKAIEYGYRYFAKMLNEQKGDVSLALASYNAGPHRVKHYGGIPPFEETVDYRNRVLRHYHGYILKLNQLRGS
jgi:soluble lytic murein transglycosylase-like protein